MKKIKQHIIRIWLFITEPKTKIDINDVSDSNIQIIIRDEQSNTN